MISIDQFKRKNTLVIEEIFLLNARENRLAQFLFLTYKIQPGTNSIFKQLLSLLQIIHFHSK